MAFLDAVDTIIHESCDVIHHADCIKKLNSLDVDWTSLQQMRIVFHHIIAKCMCEPALSEDCARLCHLIVNQEEPSKATRPQEEPSKATRMLSSDIVGHCRTLLSKPCNQTLYQFPFSLGERSHASLAACPSYHCAIGLIKFTCHIIALGFVPPSDTEALLWQCIYCIDSIQYGDPNKSHKKQQPERAKHEASATCWFSLISILHDAWRKLRSSVLHLRLSNGLVESLCTKTITESQKHLLQSVDRSYLQYLIVESGHDHCDDALGCLREIYHVEDTTVALDNLTAPSESSSHNPGYVADGLTNAHELGERWKGFQQRLMSWQRENGGAASHEGLAQIPTLLEPDPDDTESRRSSSSSEDDPRHSRSNERQNISGDAGSEGDAEQKQPADSGCCSGVTSVEKYDWNKPRRTRIITNSEYCSDSSRTTKSQESNAQ